MKSMINKSFENLAQQLYHVVEEVPQQRLTS